MENVAGEQDLALQHSLLFHSRGLKLGHFGIFDALFPFLAFFKL